VKDPDAEEIYKLLTEGGVPCFRLDEDSLVYEEEAA